MRQATITSARLALEASQSGGFRGRWLFLTLTYRDSVAWEPSHVRDFLRRARKWYLRLGVRMHYSWVMELTQRGIPHYHVVIFVPRHLLLPKADKRGWWPHGMSNTQVARNAVGYLAKYASKGVSPDVSDALASEFVPQFPKGARICGNGGLTARGRVEYRFWMMPRWLREQLVRVQDVRRLKGGGFVCCETGEIIVSDWVFIGFTTGYKQLFFAKRSALEAATRDCEFLASFVDRTMHCEAA